MFFRARRVAANRGARSVRVAGVRGDGAFALAGRLPPPALPRPARAHAMRRNEKSSSAAAHLLTQRILAPRSWRSFGGLWLLGEPKMTAGKG